MHAGMHACTHARMHIAHHTTGNWKLERIRNHRVFKRVVMMLGGDITEQTITMSCTPSDRRSCNNALAELHRKNNDVLDVLDPEHVGRDTWDKCAVYQWRYEKAQTELFALETETKEHKKGLDVTLRCKQSEVDGLLQMWVMQQSVVECRLNADLAGRHNALRLSEAPDIYCN